MRSSRRMHIWEGDRYMAEIDICFSHDSAFRLLMRSEGLGREWVVPAGESMGLSVPYGEVVACAARDLGLGPYCIDVLASDEVNCCPGIYTHRACGTDPVSVRDVSITGYGRVCVTSPELTFVQLARTHSLLETVYMGFALCSNYRVEPRAAYGVVSRSVGCGALTSREKLSAFIDAHPRMRGTGKARRALAYVRNGSNSPTESALAMGLGMPVILGGFNVGRVAMSRRNRHHVAHSLTVAPGSAEDDAVLVVHRRGAKGSAAEGSRPLVIHVLGTVNATRMPQSTLAVPLSQILDYDAYRELCLGVREGFSVTSQGSVDCRLPSRALPRRGSICGERQEAFWRQIVCMSDFRSAEFGASSPARTLPAATWAHVAA